MKGRDMKVIIEGKACFASGAKQDDDRNVDVQVLGHPDEDIEHGHILLVHPHVSLELSLVDLQAALRAFERPR